MGGEAESSKHPEGIRASPDDLAPVNLSAVELQIALQLLSWEKKKNNQPQKLHEIILNDGFIIQLQWINFLWA